MLRIVRTRSKQSMTQPPIERNPACPLWRRLAALVYDLLVAVAIVMVVGLVAQLATGGHLIDTGALVVIPVWYRPLQALVLGGYFSVSWRYGGQTLGMRPWRVQLRSRLGGAASWRQVLLRLLVAASPLGLLWLAPTLGLRPTLWGTLLAWALWFAPALFDPRRRALHDLLAGTQLQLLR